MAKLNRMTSKQMQDFDEKGWICHRCIHCIGIERDFGGVSCFAEPDPEAPEYGGGRRSPIPVGSCDDFLEAI